MAKRTNAAMRGIVNSLLTKTVGNGCEPLEEEEAMRKAAELIGQHGLSLKDFQFPERYNPSDGSRKPDRPPPKAAASGAAREQPKRPRIIKVACESLLAEVVGRDNQGLTVGHSYIEILRRVKEEFPTGKTSIKCLRWYAAHMKDQGCVMPQKRERSPAQPKE